MNSCGSGRYAPIIPAMSTDGLSAALADARRGDEQAISVLYRAINPTLLRYLRHHAGPIAEDLASEVWMAIAPRLAEFTGDIDELRALMFTVARRRAVDHHRRERRRPATVAFDEAFDRAAQGETADLAVARLTAQGAVETLVRHLSEEQAEIVLLRVLADLDVAHVAAIVGKSKGAVRVAQHRALQHLQQVWDRGAVTP